MRRIVWTALSLICVIIVPPGEPGAENDRPPLPAGVYLELSEAFYRTLAAADDGVKTLGTSSNEEYLRQIAVATRYMVETNLAILKQQERIIELLQDGRGQAPGGAR